MKKFKGDNLILKSFLVFSLFNYNFSSILHKKTSIKNSHPLSKLNFTTENFNEIENPPNKIDF